MGSRARRFRFDLLPEPGDATRVQLPHPEILKALTQGKQLLLDAPHLGGVKPRKLIESNRSY